MDGADIRAVMAMSMRGNGNAIRCMVPGSTGIRVAGCMTGDGKSSLPVLLVLLHFSDV